MTNKELDDFYDKLKNTHSKYPELRFGQLIECVFYRLKKDGRDPFYIKDEELLKIIGESYGKREGDN